MIRVFIVHPNHLVCASLAAIFNNQPDISVHCFATNVADTIERIQDCNVVLASTALTHKATLELIESLTHLNPAIKVLIMGQIESEEVLARYVKAGAAGCIQKPDSANSLLEQLRATYEGQPLLSPQEATGLMSQINGLLTA